LHFPQTKHFIIKYLFNLADGVEAAISIQHIYNACKMLIIDKDSLPYKVLQRLEQNLKIRDNLTNKKEEPCDPSGSAA
jgi:hypothetical protein